MGNYTGKLRPMCPFNVLRVFGNGYIGNLGTVKFGLGKIHLNVC